LEILREIETFETKVKSLVEYDYGDFMRKSNMYLNRLLENFKQLSDEQRTVFLQLKSELQFAPVRDIDVVTEKVLAKTKQLKTITK
jgi:hypothetical protein